MVILSKWLCTSAVKIKTNPADKKTFLVIYRPVGLVLLAILL